MDLDVGSEVFSMEIAAKWQRIAQPMDEAASSMIDSSTVDDTYFSGTDDIEVIF